MGKKQWIKYKIGEIGVMGNEYWVLGNIKSKSIGKLVMVKNQWMTDQWMMNGYVIMVLNTQPMNFGEITYVIHRGILWRDNGISLNIMGATGKSCYPSVN